MTTTRPTPCATSAATVRPTVGPSSRAGTNAVTSSCGPVAEGSASRRSAVLHARQGARSTMSQRPKAARAISSIF
jgi:hypothetical protein